MTEPTDNFEKVWELLQAIISAGSYDPVTHVFTPGSGAPPATTVTGPDAYGDPAVVGTGTHYARDDHDHGLPAAPAAFPTFTGSGSPEGVQAATVVGQTYQDTTTGAVWTYEGTPPSNTGWVDTTSQLVSSISTYAQADSPTTVACDGATHTVALVKATPPSWLDGAGNIILPGVYQTGVFVTLSAAPTLPAVYCLVAGTNNVNSIIPLDAYNSAPFVGNEIGLAVETYSLLAADLPFPCSVRFLTPTDATASMTAAVFANQIATPV